MEKTLPKTCQPQNKKNFGGRPRKNDNSPVTSAKPADNSSETSAKPTNNSPETSYINKNINIKGNKKGESKERNNPPTLAEVKKFCNDEKLSVNPDKFFYHYQSRNWDGVDDWRARLRYWQAEDSDKPQTNSASPIFDASAYKTALVSGKHKPTTSSKSPLRVSPSNSV